MIPWSGALLLAGVLDAWAGDPRWGWHPVRLMGRAAMALEHPLRRIIPHPRLAGIAVALLLASASATAAGLLVIVTGWMHPVAGGLAAVLALYATVAARDMQDHAHAVLAPLNTGNLPAARHALSRMVGRDTDTLDEGGIARATVESIAEGFVDGVAAPLFWAVVGGMTGGVLGAWLVAEGHVPECILPRGGLPLRDGSTLTGLVGMAMGAVFYRAVNTLDSTFGYKTEAYLRFGWASARLDDGMNWVPARLAAWFIALSSVCLRLGAAGSLRTWWRDGAAHESPNAGQCEAAMAGALGVELGGACTYGGEVVEHPRIGVGGRRPGAADIMKATRLFRAAFWLFLLAGIAAGLVAWGIPLQR